jgi:hypothetical protein
VVFFHGGGLDEFGYNKAKEKYKDGVTMAILREMLNV